MATQFSFVIHMNSLASEFFDVYITFILFSTASCIFILKEALAFLVAILGHCQFDRLPRCSNSTQYIHAALIQLPGGDFHTIELVRGIATLIAGFVYLPLAFVVVKFVKFVKFVELQILAFLPTFRKLGCLRHRRYTILMSGIVKIQRSSRVGV